jgi:uncharacterized circularly permuted ATP-grasp superfamily protein
MGSELEAAYDEAWAEPGVPRTHYEDLIEALRGADLVALAAAVMESLADDGVRFGNSTFVVDAVPRIIPAQEWEALERGLIQRAKALNRFLQDAYGAQEIVAAGHIARAVVESAEGFERELAGQLPKQRWPAAIIGFDVVRGAGGEYLVLEDNLRTPSGFAYALAARAALTSALPEEVSRPRPLAAPLWEGLDAVMRAAAPARATNPTIVVLTDGPDNVAYYEHALAAHELGAVLATPDQLVVENGFLWLHDELGNVGAVHVVYRRTNEDRIRDERGELTSVAEKLLEPWLRGNIGLVNAFGNGVADDKLVHSHVEDFIRFYLQEEPQVRSVPTTSVQDGAEAVMGKLNQLVVKPRHGHGGIGVVVGPHAHDADLDELARLLRQDPTGYIAQPTITLSVHPTIVGERLELRHVDLRPFSFAAEDITLPPGGLSRVAFGEGALVVNSSQNGGGKDTWVMPEDPS